MKFVLSAAIAALAVTSTQAGAFPVIPVYSLIQTPDQGAEAAAIRSLTMPMTVESDVEIAPGKRLVTVNDHGRRCIVELAYDPSIPKLLRTHKSSGWEAKNISCAAGELAFLAK